MQTLSKTFSTESCTAFNKFFNLINLIIKGNYLQKTQDIIIKKSLKSFSFYYLRINNSFFQIKVNT